MPNRADDGNRAVINRARHNFLVERPQILHRAAAAPDDDDLDLRDFRRASNALRDALRRPCALHLNRHQHQRHAGVTRPRHHADIVQHRACFRRDDRDFLRAIRQAPLVLLVEQPLRRQAVFQRLELLIQRADAVRTHTVAGNLVAAALAVQPDLPADDDGHAVHWANRHAHRVLPEHDRRDSAPLVLEGKVPMPGRMALEVADFPAQTDFAKRRLVLQQLPDVLVDLADLQNPLRHGAFTSYLYRLILPSASPPLPPCFPAARQLSFCPRRRGRA